MDLEASRKQLQLIRELVARMDQGSTRSDVLNVLLEKGYERKDASRLVDAIERDYQKLVNQRKLPQRLIISGIVSFLIGSAMFVFGWIYLDILLDRGIIGTSTLFFGGLKWMGLLTLLGGLVSILMGIIKKNQAAQEQEKPLDH